jgi:hypothetical protein
MSQENVDAVKAGYAAFRAAWTTNDRVPYEAWLRDAAADEFEFRGRGRRSRAELEIDQWQVWTFREGKAVRGRLRSPRARMGLGDLRLEVLG